MNHYERLGVARSASHDEIRAAYRRLARLLHPDAGGAASAGAMAELNAAWHVLSDANRRAAYDRSLAPRVVAAPPSAPPRRPEPAFDIDDDDDDLVPLGVDDAVMRRWLQLIVGTSVLAVVVVGAMFVYAFTRSVG